MELRFTQSSRKHRIGKTHAKHVLSTSEPWIHGEEGTTRIIYDWIGFDERGVEIEITGILEEGYIAIIHVMPTSLEEIGKGRDHGREVLRPRSFWPWYQLR